MVDSHGVHKHRRRRTHSKKRMREKQREKFFRSYGLQGCLILVLVSLIPTWYLMTRGTPPPLPPQDVLKSQSHLSDIRKLLQQVRLDGQLGKEHPFEFKLGSRDLEVGLTTEGDAMDVLRAKAIEISAVSVNNGHVEIDASGPQTGSNSMVKVFLSPVIKDGSLSFKPDAREGKDESVGGNLAVDIAGALERLTSASTVRYLSLKSEGNSLVLTGDTADRGH